MLGDDQKLNKYLLPFKNQQQPKAISLLTSLQDGKPNWNTIYLLEGVLLSHLIEHLKQGAIQLEKLHYNIDMSNIGQRNSKALFEVGENLNMCVSGAKKLQNIGVVVINLGANDILGRNVDVVLGLGSFPLRISL